MNRRISVAVSRTINMPLQSSHRSGQHYYARGGHQDMNRRISVAVSRTINMGNFNSLRVEAGLESGIKDGSSLQDGYKNLWNSVNAEINRAIAAFNKETKT